MIAEFLVVRASTHLSMLPYAADVPGLVHFVFVDRSQVRVCACVICVRVLSQSLPRARAQHRVFAPDVTPLHGESCCMYTATVCDINH
jgi:hypothetical protein